MRWRAAVVALALLVAGCGAIADGPAESTPRETVTPAPVPTDTTAGPTLPPGVSGGGDVDAEALARAHLAALENRSYVKRVNRSVGDRASSATLRVESATRYGFEYVKPATGDRVSVFADGAVRYAWDRQFPPHYSRNDVTEVTTSHGDDAARAIRRYLNLSNATVAETLVDGDLHYLVTAERDDDATADYRVRAVVAPDGLVRSLSVSYVDREDGRLVGVSYSHRYDRRPVTVERPDWVDDQWGNATGGG